MTLTSRGWGFLGIGAILWASWFVVQLRDVWYPAAFVILLVILSAILTSARAFLARWRVSLHADSPTPAVGEIVNMTATVTHRLPLALRATLTWEVADDSAVLTVRVPRTGTMDIGAAWTPARRGETPARIRGLTVGDPLGLAVARVRTGAAYEFLVLPRPLDDLPELPSSGGAHNTGPRDGRRLAIPVAGEPGGAVRDYRVGDALRQVHWKQSARQDQLLVNIPEESETFAYSLLLIVLPSAYATDDDFERAVSAAAALGVRWLHEGHAVQLRLGTESAVLVTEPATLLRALARVTLGSHRDTASQDVLAAGAVDVVVTGRLTSELRALLGSDTVRPGHILTAAEVPDGGDIAGWSITGIPAPESGARALSGDRGG